MDFLVVGFGGLLGSLSRYAISLALGSAAPGAFPRATFLVNLVGCFAVGVGSVLVERAVPYHRQIYLVGGIGFLGAFTTFSAFGLETVRLLEGRHYGVAAAYALGSVVLGLALVAAGRNVV
jgi:CrcB protein